MGYGLKKLVVFISSLIVSAILIFNGFKDPIDIDNQYYILPEYNDVYYQQTSFNTLLTQRAAFNNVKYNLQELGYITVFERVFPEYIDCGYKSQDLELRFYFDIESGELTIFSNQYEACESVMTYIIERINK